MKARIHELDTEQARSLLTVVVERNYPLAIEMKSGSIWVRFKSRFLGHAGSETPVLWVEVPQNVDDNTGVTLGAGERFIGSFTFNQDRYRFASAVRRLGTFRLAGGMAVEGMMIAFPPRVQRVQRRKHFRCELPSTRTIAVRCWDGGLEHAAAALDAETRPLYHGRLLDLSLGGCRFRLGGGQDPRWDVNDTIGLAFTPDDHTDEIRSDAIVRRLTAAEGRPVELGVQFVGLERSAEGRRAMDHLSHTLAELERKVIRHHRIGLKRMTLD